MNESNQPQFILSLDYFMKVERLSKLDPLLMSDSNSSDIYQSANNIHHKAIFDAFNEALDLERPYKYKG